MQHPVRGTRDQPTGVPSATNFEVVREWRGPIATLSPPAAMAIRHPARSNPANSRRGGRGTPCAMRARMTIEPLPHIPEHERPRERLKRVGVEALAEAELLALVLGTGRPNEPVDVLSARLLGDYGGARGLFHVGAGELAGTLGFARAARLSGALELARRALAAPLDARSPYGSSRDVVRAYAPRLVDRVDEQVIAVVLDSRHRAVAERRIATGGPASCGVSLREIFALAIREGGLSLLLVHNHPSGDPAPSREDVALTCALVRAGDALELPLLDHVIVGREGSFSFLDAGLLRPDAAAASSAGSAS